MFRGDTHRDCVLEDDALCPFSLLFGRGGVCRSDVSACGEIAKGSVGWREGHSPNAWAAARKMSGLGLPRPGLTSGESAVIILSAGKREKISGRCDWFQDALLELGVSSQASVAYRFHLEIGIVGSGGQGDGNTYLMLG